MEKTKKVKKPLTLGQVIETVTAMEEAHTVPKVVEQELKVPGFEVQPKSPLFGLNGKALTTAIQERREALAKESASGFYATRDGFTKWDIIHAIVAWDNECPILAIAQRVKTGDEFQTIGHVRWQFDWKSGKLSPYSGEICPVTLREERAAQNKENRERYQAHIKAELARNPIAQALQGIDLANFGPAPKNAK